MKKLYYFITNICGKKGDINRLFLYKGKSIKFSFKKTLHLTITFLLSTSFIFIPLYGMDNIGGSDEGNAGDRSKGPAPFPQSTYQIDSLDIVAYSETASSVGENPMSVTNVTNNIGHQGDVHFYIENLYLHSLASSSSEDNIVEAMSPARQEAIIRNTLAVPALGRSNPPRAAARAPQNRPEPTSEDHVVRVWEGIRQQKHVSGEASSVEFKERIKNAWAQKNYRALTLLRELCLSDNLLISNYGFHVLGDLLKEDNPDWDSFDMFLEQDSSLCQMIYERFFPLAHEGQVNSLNLFKKMLERFPEIQVYWISLLRARIPLKEEDLIFLSENSSSTELQDISQDYLLRAFKNNLQNSDSLLVNHLLKKATSRQKESTENPMENMPYNAESEMAEDRLLSIAKYVDWEELQILQLIRYTSFDLLRQFMENMYLNAMQESHNLENDLFLLGYVENPDLDKEIYERLFAKSGEQENIRHRIIKLLKSKNPLIKTKNPLTKERIYSLLRNLFKAHVFPPQKDLVYLLADPNSDIRDFVRNRILLDLEEKDWNTELLIRLEKSNVDLVLKERSREQIYQKAGQEGEKNKALDRLIEIAREEEINAREKARDKLQELAKIGNSTALEALIRIAREEIDLKENLEENISSPSSSASLSQVDYQEIAAPVRVERNPAIVEEEAEEENTGEKTTEEEQTSGSPVLSQSLKRLLEVLRADIDISVENLSDMTIYCRYREFNQLIQEKLLSLIQTKNEKSKQAFDIIIELANHEELRVKQEAQHHLFILAREQQEQRALVELTKLLESEVSVRARGAVLVAVSCSSASASREGFSNSTARSQGRVGDDLKFSSSQQRILNYISEILESTTPIDLENLKPLLKYVEYEDLREPLQTRLFEIFRSSTQKATEISEKNREGSSGGLLGDSEYYTPAVEFLHYVATDHIQNPVFIERPIDKDGDCGFHGLGLSREEAGRQLIEELEKPESTIQLLLLPDLLEAFRGGDWPQSLDNDQEYQRLRTIYLIGEGSQENEDLKNYLLQPHIQRAFIADYISGGGWMTYVRGQTGMLDALAQINNLQVNVWVPNEEDRGKLDLVHRANHESNQVVHLIHRDGLTHFNLLEVKEAQSEVSDLDEASDSEVEEIIDSLLYVGNHESIEIRKFFLMKLVQLINEDLSSEPINVLKSLANKFYAQDEALILLRKFAQQGHPKALEILVELATNEETHLKLIGKKARSFLARLLRSNIDIELPKLLLLSKYFDIQDLNELVQERLISLLENFHNIDKKSADIRRIKRRLVALATAWGKRDKRGFVVDSFYTIRRGKVPKIEDYLPLQDQTDPEEDSLEDLDKTSRGLGSSSALAKPIGRGVLSPSFNSDSRGTFLAETNSRTGRSSARDEDEETRAPPRTISRGGDEIDSAETIQDTGRASSSRISTATSLREPSISFSREGLELRSSNQRGRAVSPLEEDGLEDLDEITRAGGFSSTSARPLGRGGPSTSFSSDSRGNFLAETNSRTSRSSARDEDAETSALSRTIGRGGDERDPAETIQDTGRSSSPRMSSATLVDQNRDSLIGLSTLTEEVRAVSPSLSQQSSASPTNLDVEDFNKSSSIPSSEDSESQDSEDLDSQDSEEKNSLFDRWSDDQIKFVSQAAQDRLSGLLMREIYFFKKTPVLVALIGYGDSKILTSLASKVLLGLIKEGKNLSWEEFTILARYSENKELREIAYNFLQKETEKGSRSFATALINLCSDFEEAQERVESLLKKDKTRWFLDDLKALTKLSNSPFLNKEAHLKLVNCFWTREGDRANILDYFLSLLDHDQEVVRKNAKESLKAILEDSRGLSFTELEKFIHRCSDENLNEIIQRKLADIVEKNIEYSEKAFEHLENLSLSPTGFISKTAISHLQNLSKIKIYLQRVFLFFLANSFEDPLRNVCYGVQPNEIVDLLKSLNIDFRKQSINFLMNIIRNGKDTRKIILNILKNLFGELEYRQELELENALDILSFPSVTGNLKRDLEERVSDFVGRENDITKLETWAVGSNEVLKTKAKEALRNKLSRYTISQLVDYMNVIGKDISLKIIARDFLKGKVLSENELPEEEKVINGLAEILESFFDEAFKGKVLDFLSGLARKKSKEAQDALKRLANNENENISRNPIFILIQLGDDWALERFYRSTTTTSRDTREASTSMSQRNSRSAASSSSGGGGQGSSSGTSSTRRSNESSGRVANDSNIGPSRPLAFSSNSTVDELDNRLFETLKTSPENLSIKTLFYMTESSNAQIREKVLKYIESLAERGDKECLRELRVLKGLAEDTSSPFHKIVKKQELLQKTLQRASNVSETANIRNTPQPTARKEVNSASSSSSPISPKPKDGEKKEDNSNKKANSSSSTGSNNGLLINSESSHVNLPGSRAGSGSQPSGISYNRSESDASDECCCNDCKKLCRKCVIL